MTDASGKLLSLLREEIHQDVTDEARAVAEAARLRHGKSVVAVLFYGSCLRDRETTDRVMDLYLLVDDYRGAYDGSLEALANRLLPPNVYAIKTSFGDQELRAKYAVVSTHDFVAGLTGRWHHPYLWARFAQPCALLFVRDRATERALLDALAAAPAILLTAVKPLVAANAQSREFWCAAFRLTYGCELRSERGERANALYTHTAERYDEIFALLEPNLRAAARSPRSARWHWTCRRALGKVLSVLRLIKAAYTFTDGADYLLWKIERHSGVTVELTGWQRRHPILASPALYWRLYRKGAFR